MKDMSIFNTAIDMFDFEMYEKAYEYFLEEAIAEEPHSCLMIGLMYLYGYYPKQDFGKAFQFIRLAIDYSDHENMPYTILNKLLEAMDIIEENRKAGECYISFMIEMIEKEFWGYCICVANDYGMGRIFPKDVAKEIEYYEMAAEHGIEFGYECLGEMFFKGEKVERDYEKAYEYFMKTEEINSHIKPYYLGEMYREGIIVEKDIEKAREYYQSVADDERGKKYNDQHYVLAVERLRELERGELQ